MKCDRAHIWFDSDVPEKHSIVMVLVTSGIDVDTKYNQCGWLESQSDHADVNSGISIMKSNARARTYLKSWQMT